MKKQQQTHDGHPFECATKAARYTERPWRRTAGLLRFHSLPNDRKKAPCSVSMPGAPGAAPAPGRLNPAAEAPLA
jgi:hypothetical protein